MPIFTRGPGFFQVHEFMSYGIFCIQTQKKYYMQPCDTLPRHNHRYDPLQMFTMRILL